jgi:predicted transcriptional regulator
MFYYNYLTSYVILYKYSYLLMKNRSRTEIVGNILDAANGGATKIKIMYVSFLGYNQLKEYLSFLIENNLLEYLEGNRTFKTTEKGLKFLRMQNEIGELLQNYHKKR